MPILAAAAVTAAPDALPIAKILMGLFGGMALVLFGLDQMSAALKAVAGERMKQMLDRLTTNRFMGVVTGTAVTAVLQSSTVTTVLLVGFVSSGLMTLPQSIGVILGANIGSTITAQIIAFKVTEYALLLVAAGYFAMLAGRLEGVKLYGKLALGLGLLFLGLSVLGDGMAPFKTYPPFHRLMEHMANPLLGVLAGAIFTALVHSSAATTSIAIVLAGQGLLTLPAGIALALGANIGTCVTALMASIGKPREAIRAALVHVIFNVVGVLLWVGLIDQLADLVTWLSPRATDLQGTARLAAEVPRQIANAHTLFNVANTLLFIGFTTQMARLVVWLLPDRPAPAAPETIQPQYLDDTLLPTPALALERLHLEVHRLGTMAVDMLGATLPAVLHGDAAEVQALFRRDDDLDALHSAIIDYARQLSRSELQADQTVTLHHWMEAADAIESIGDVISTNLATRAERRLQNGIQISGMTGAVLAAIHWEVLESLQLAVEAVETLDRPKAHVVEGMKARINQLADEAAAHQQHRLLADAPNRIEAYAIETDVRENYKRVYYFAKRLARTLLANGHHHGSTGGEDDDADAGSESSTSTASAADPAAAAKDVLASTRTTVRRRSRPPISPPDIPGPGEG